MRVGYACPQPAGEACPLSDVVVTLLFMLQVYADVTRRPLSLIASEQGPAICVPAGLLAEPAPQGVV